MIFEGASVVSLPKLNLLVGVLGELETVMTPPSLPAFCSLPKRAVPCQPYSPHKTASCHAKQALRSHCAATELACVVCALLGKQPDLEASLRLCA
eukprot:5674402-Amphidinium_carterae.1